jgi:hypothetical protein
VFSTQVLQEFYVVATRKFDPPMPRGRARQIVALYAEWPVVQIDVLLLLAASELEDATPSRSGTRWSSRRPGARARPAS